MSEKTTTLTRIALELDSDLIERLDSAQARTFNPDKIKSALALEDLVAARLQLTADYDLTGAPLFLSDSEHRRLRALTRSAAVRGTQTLLDDLEAMTRLSVMDGGEPLTLKASWLERLASRAKVEGKTPAQLALELAERGIREGIGL